MKSYHLIIDKNLTTKAFLLDAVEKYFDKSLSKIPLLEKKLAEVIFVKSEHDSEKFVVEFNNKALKFCGNDRSIIYALFDFLERLGWRFFTSDLEVCLTNSSLRFNSAFSYSYEPVFEYRLNLWDCATDEWAIKNGINAFYGKTLLDDFGGSISYAGAPVHTFNRLIPAKEYFETNPEFFAIGKDGKRIKNQLCLSNEMLFDEIIKKAKQLLSDNPSANIISISQNDLVFTECQCDNCKKIKGDGNASDVMIWFVNKVAEELKKDYPNVKIQTLAYNYTVDAPKNYKPSDNVIIEFCPIESCENHAANDITCWRNKKFVKQISAWNKVTNNIYLWKYYKDFNYYLTPFQFLENQRESFNFYAQNGVKGFFAEGSHCGKTTDFCELKAYVLAKLIFNPNMSEIEYQRHIKSFCINFYGSCSGLHMLKYLKLLKEVSVNSHYDCYPAPYTVISTNPKEPVNDKYFLKRAKDIFKKALLSAENEQYKNRIEKEFIAVLYFSLYTNFENEMLNANKAKRKKILEEQNLLFELIDKHKIKNVRSFNSGINVKKIL